MATMKEIKNLFLLATYLQSSSNGLTKNELIEKCKEIDLSPSKRTIERWISNLVDLGLQIETKKLSGDHHLISRYKIFNIPKVLLKISPLERSALERHLQIVSDKKVKQAISKMLSIKQPLSIEMINNNQKLIDQTDYAFNYGVRIELNRNEVIKIEQSIEMGTEIRFKYFEKLKTFNKFIQVKPIGLLFDRFCWLIAMNSKNKYLLYRIDLIKDISKTNILFDKPSVKDIKNRYEKNYGIPRGKKKLNISIKFSKQVSHLVKNIIFHPSQTKTLNKDNSIILNLNCTFSRELIHELIHPDWLGEVNILEPKELKLEFKKYLELCSKIAI